MTGNSRKPNRDETSVELHGVFAGFNEAYATSIMDGDTASPASDGANGVETDFEYDGILLDPSFEVSFAPGINGHTDEPVDERWIGENPIAHYAWMKGDTVPMEEARRRWGV